MARPTPLTALLVAVVLLIALNLRPAVVGVAPLIDEMRADLGFSGAAASMLTTLPLLCFGFGALGAARLGRRFGLEAVLMATMLGLVGGCLLRLWPASSALSAAPCWPERPSRWATC